MQVGPVVITKRLCPDVTLKLLIIVLQKNSAEFGLTIAAVPIVLFLLAMCGFAVRREIKWSGYSFCYYHPRLTTKQAHDYIFGRYVGRGDLFQYVFFQASQCDLKIQQFIVYKLVRMYQPGSEAQYVTTRATLTTFSEYRKAII